MGLGSFGMNTPRRIAKVEAGRAWRKLTVADRQAAIEGVRAWKESDQWQRDDGRYIPYPATFLNQRRWEGDIPRRVITTEKF